MALANDALKGRHILLVEDEYFIADDLKRSVSAYGGSVAGPVATLREALNLLDSDQNIDGAVLDINLRGEHVYPLADRLIASGVPFLFLTGYDAHVLPQKYSGIVRCEKPLAMHKVVAALS
jgi:DNA-binding response OmpR family regulator